MEDYKKLDMDKLHKKKSKFISTEEALKDVEPYIVHVYCTNCKNFHYVMDCIEDDSYLKDCENCKCKDCNCSNPEDSMRFEDRPNYEFNRI
jgi:DNA polymerase III alpha subunit (gram-positive type)